MNQDYDYYDYDYVDPKLDRFLSNVHPEIRRLFDAIVIKEGYDQGKYIFGQVLAEMVHRFGLIKTAEICNKGLSVLRESLFSLYIN